jgi:membrane-bound lytic murein transglycosylase D
MKLTPHLLVVSTAGLLVGCSAHARPDVTPPPPLPVTPVAEIVAPAAAIQPDPYREMLARVDREFAAGQQALAGTRPVAAREHFDAAVDLLLALPEGARREPRIAAEFDRLLDRISALDLLALREGDGFTETRSEPAAIDELLNAAIFERPQPAETTEETVRADLARRPRDLPIPLNNKVLSFVELFQGRLHDFMEESLQRSVRYMPMIEEVFAEEGLPLDLAWVPLVESGFKPNALSRASARGLWQFMLPTGRGYGLEQTWFVDDRSDPEKATRAAAQYLKTLHDMFGGDWNLALASYNGGPGRMQRAVRLSKSRDFWQITRTTRYLPRETRDYVPMIMAAIIIANNPSLYGFDVVASGPVAHQSVTVPNALDLKVVAEWIDVSVDLLRELNPELRRTTPPARSHDLKVPVGTAATIQARLATDDPPYAHFTFHTVKRGETVAALARRYKVTQSDLRQANDLTARASIRANQTLMIPQRSASGLPSSSAAATRVAAAKTPTPTPTAGPINYRVRRGDTLIGIARQFGTTVTRIKQLNQLSSDRINIGDRLTVRQ